MYEFTIAQRHILRNPKMAFFTVAAVTLAVAVIVVLMGLMSGFEDEVITTTVENNPHIYVQPKEDEKYVYLYRTVSAILWKYPEVEAVSARLAGKAAAKYKDKVRGVDFLGVDPVEEDRLMNVQRDIVIGNFQDLNPGSMLRLWDRLWRMSLKLHPEDDFILARGNKSIRLKVAGLFETGSAKDKSLIYIPLTTAQDLVGKGDVVSEVDARVSDIYQAPYITADLRNQFRYQSKSWEDMNADILELIQTQSSFSIIFYILIFLIAGFGIANTMIMIISRKTKEIGILMAMGATRMVDSQDIYAGEPHPGSAFGLARERSGISRGQAHNVLQHRASFRDLHRLQDDGLHQAGVLPVRSDLRHYHQLRGRAVSGLEGFQDGSGGGDRKLMRD